MAERDRASILWPAMAALLAGVLYAGWRLAEADWDPLALAELGERFQAGDPQGGAGYDGQFNYYIALEPSPAVVAPHLDVPAYRYQRILYPLLARVLSFGSATWLPWTLLGLNLLAHTAGAALVSAYLTDKGLSPLYGLSYALWVGLLAPVGLDLNEPLSYALIAAAWLLRGRHRPLLSALCLGLALFAKETALVLWAAALMGSWLGDRDRRYTIALALAGAAYAAWQLWLYLQFGQFGLASGGDMATPFEWIPFMGLWRIGTVSLRALALYVVIFGPTVVLPAAWGALASARSLLAAAPGQSQFALLLSSLAIMALPFSTFREPLGLIRAMDSLVLAVLLFASDQFEGGSAAARSRSLRILRFALLWIPLLAILING